MTGLTRGMRVLLLAVGAVVVVGLAVSFWMLQHPPTTSGAPAGAGTPAATTLPSAAGSGAAASRPAATAGPLPEATPTSGSEVLPPTATPRTTLPPVPAATALLPAPLPGTANAKGALAQGFPARVMGPTTGSTVVSSAISTTQGTSQVTLVARTASSRAEVTAHYAKLWSSMGLQPQKTVGKTLAYKGRHGSVTLTFGSTGTGTRYSIYGVFRAK